MGSTCRRFGREKPIRDPSTVGGYHSVAWTGEARDPRKRPSWGLQNGLIRAAGSPPVSAAVDSEDQAGRRGGLEGAAPFTPKMAALSSSWPTERALGQPKLLHPLGQAWFVETQKVALHVRRRRLRITGDPLAIQTRCSVDGDRPGYCVRRAATWPPTVRDRDGGGVGRATSSDPQRMAWALGNPGQRTRGRARGRRAVAVVEDGRMERLRRGVLRHRLRWCNSCRKVVLERCPDFHGGKRTVNRLRNLHDRIEYRRALVAHAASPRRGRRPRVGWSLGLGRVSFEGVTGRGPSRAPQWGGWGFSWLDGGPGDTEERK